MAIFFLEHPFLALDVLHVLQKSSSDHAYGGFHQSEPRNAWFIMANPMNMDDEGGTPILGTLHMKKNMFNHC